MDIRFPIGYMFTILGVILAAVGVSPLAGVEKAQGININLWWGLVMVLFGGMMLGLAFSALKKAKAKADGACGSGCGCSK